MEKQLLDQIKLLEDTIAALKLLVDIKDQTIRALQAQPKPSFGYPQLIPLVSPHIIMNPPWPGYPAPYVGDLPYTQPLVTCGGTYETQQPIGASAQIGSGYGVGGGVSCAIPTDTHTVIYNGSGEKVDTSKLPFFGRMCVSQWSTN